MFTLAARNNIEIPFNSPQAVRDAYQFNNLWSFLDIYYQSTSVLIHEQDFFDLAWAYLLRCKQDNVIHTEIFFDPQIHTHLGSELGHPPEKFTQVFKAAINVGFKTVAHAGEEGSAENIWNTLALLGTTRIEQIP